MFWTTVWVQAKRHSSVLTRAAAGTLDGCYVPLIAHCRYTTANRLSGSLTSLLSLWERRASSVCLAVCSVLNAWESQIAVLRSAVDEISTASDASSSLRQTSAWDTSLYHSSEQLLCCWIHQVWHTADMLDLLSSLVWHANCLSWTLLKHLLSSIIIDTLYLWAQLFDRGCGLICRLGMLLVAKMGVL